MELSDDLFMATFLWMMFIAFLAFVVIGFWDRLFFGGFSLGCILFFILIVRRVESSFNPFEKGMGRFEGFANHKLLFPTVFFITLFLVLWNMYASPWSF